MSAEDDPTSIFMGRPEKKKKIIACECKATGVRESLGIKRYKCRLIFIQDHSVALQDVTKG